MRLESSASTKTNGVVTRDKMNNKLNGILSKKNTSTGGDNKNSSVKQWIDSQPSNYVNNGECSCVRPSVWYYGAAEAKQGGPNYLD